MLPIKITNIENRSFITLKRFFENIGYGERMKKLGIVKESVGVSIYLKLVLVRLPGVARSLVC